MIWVKISVFRIQKKVDCTVHIWEASGTERGPTILWPLFCSVGILEFYLGVWQTSTDSWYKGALAKTVPITLNLSRGKEGERETHTHREWELPRATT